MAPTHRSSSFLTTGLLLAALPLASHAAPSPPQTASDGGFRSGDLVYFSHALFGPSSGSAGILRIDPISGQTDLVLGPVFGTTANVPDLAYDPFRGALVVHVSLDGLTSDTYLVDAAGNTQSMGLPGILATNFAPTGDGRIYFEPGGGAFTDIQYFDATGSVQQLMDSTGLAPFQLDPAFATGLAGMIFDPGTNALFVATGAGTMTCPGGLGPLGNVHKIPLSPDGSQTSGPVQCVQFDVDTTGFGETPKGWSRGPQGELYLSVDTNLNGQQPRLLLVDPVGPTVSTFASNGPYIGDAATSAGAYSHTRAQGFLVDTFGDALRSFAEGSTGSGTTVDLIGFSSISPAGGSGEHCVLIEVGPVGPHDGLAAAPLEISIAAGGSQTWTLDLGPAYANQLYLVVGSGTGWNPPLAFGGVDIPLIPDVYSNFSAANANTAFYPGSFGSLSASGQGAAALALPPAAVGPSGAGAIFHHAGVILDLSASVLFATNAVPLELIP